MMLNDDHRSVVGPIKKTLYCGIAFVLSFLLLEAGLRIIFAIEIGPRVLLYGTSYYRNMSVHPRPGGIQLVGDVDAHRKGNHAAVGNTDYEIGSTTGGYAKYFPNESKIDFDEEGNSFSVSINDQGFRGRRFSRQKTLGVVRVIALGASSTFGYFDRDDETYPYLLEQELNQSGGGVSFEVLNLGIPHLTSRQILELFLAEALSLDPDVVTFYEGINDSSQMSEETWEKKHQEHLSESAIRRFRMAVAHLRPFRAAYTIARSRLITLALIDSLLVNDVLTYDRQDLERHIDGKSAGFLASLSALRDVCRQRGIVFIVLKQQARSMSAAEVKGLTYDQEVKLVQEKLNATNSITHQEKTFLTHKIIMDDLESWARSENVPMIDVIKVLDGDRDVLLSWVHLNPRGNRMIAEALAPEILLELRRAGRM